jgi:hypothetical protein
MVLRGIMKTKIIFVISIIFINCIINVVSKENNLIYKRLSIVKNYGNAYTLYINYDKFNIPKNESLFGLYYIIPFSNYSKYYKIKNLKIVNDNDFDSIFKFQESSSANINGELYSKNDFKFVKSDVEISILENNLINIKKSTPQNLVFNENGYITTSYISTYNFLRLYEQNCDYSYIYNLENQTFDNRKQINEIIKKDNNNNIIKRYKIVYDSYGRIIGINEKKNDEINISETYYIYLSHILYIVSKFNTTNDYTIDVKIFNEFGYIKEECSIENYKIEFSNYEELLNNLLKIKFNDSNKIIANDSIISIPIFIKIENQKIFLAKYYSYFYSNAANEFKDNLKLQYIYYNNDLLNDYFLGILDYYRFVYEKSLNN